MFCFLITSCKFASEKKEKDFLNDSKELENKMLPNIFVVKKVFYSKDSLPISADFYEVNEMKPTILLCHQAGYSRGEYRDTAIKLNHLGFSCVAIDQRSGKEVNGLKNETVLKAIDKGLSTGYLDAKQDIEAAIDYVYETNGNQPIMLVGSSYSATLALLVGKSSKKVKAIAAFSPGEYFKNMNVKELIEGIDKPVFVTSSKKETKDLEELVSLLNLEVLTHFKSEKEGIHGSRALWDSTDGSEAYWAAFKTFIKKNKPTN